MKPELCVQGAGERTVGFFFFSLSRKHNFSFPLVLLICLWKYYIVLGKMEEGQLCPSCLSAGASYQS